VAVLNGLGGLPSRRRLLPGQNERMPSGARTAGIALGAACAAALLLSPAVLADAAGSVLVPAVLPLGFFAAGGTAQVLRPGHPVGDRLLAVGVLHLAALVGAVVGALQPPAGVAVPVAWLSALLYAFGFVALLDLLARYPTGRYAWPWVGPVVVGAAVVSVAVVAVALLASPDMPSVLGLAAGDNPTHVPGLTALEGVVGALGAMPLAGVALLLARYRRAPAPDRAQMRWPMVTAAVIALALVTTGWAEEVLGADAQSALFVTAGAALPAAFLVGLLRHAEEAERLAELTASRARLAAVADEERRRIERNLHDGAQQQLLALLARVELARGDLAAGNRSVDSELAAIADDLRTVHRDLRELARGVHPAVLTDQGLAEAVRSAMQRLPGPASLHVAPAIEGTRFPPAVEGAAYFLVLEGLTNALRHADGAGVAVELDRSGDSLAVTVRDSGPGFHEDGDGSGSGLVGLRDRLAAVGGTLLVDSRPDAGTTLRGLLPVGAHAGG
jgi:signal transduction histidine kinase